MHVFEAVATWAAGDSHSVWPRHNAAGSSSDPSAGSPAASRSPSCGPYEAVDSNGFHGNSEGFGPGLRTQPRNGLTHSCQSGTHSLDWGALSADGASPNAGSIPALEQLLPLVRFPLMGDAQLDALKRHPLAACPSNLLRELLLEAAACHEAGEVGSDLHHTPCSWPLLLDRFDIAHGSPPPPLVNKPPRPAPGRKLDERLRAACRAGD